MKIKRFFNGVKSGNHNGHTLSGLEANVHATSWGQWEGGRMGYVWIRLALKTLPGTEIQRSS